MRTATRGRLAARPFRRAQLYLILSLVVTLSACTGPSIALPGIGHHPLPIPTAASPAAESYLLTAFEFVQGHYYYGSQINWGALKRRVFQRAANARTRSGTYPAIRYLLQALRPSAHTYFLTPGEARLRLAPPAPSYASGRSLPPDLGYLELPSFGYTAIPQAQLYATRAQNVIESVAASSPCGWIVDLRGNVGGGFPPMLAAIGPILGAGQAGSFVSANGSRTAWSYQAGSVIYGSQTELQIPNAYALPVGTPPVAVLTNMMTASAAEATLISFIGRPNTRTFGQPTFGAPSFPDVKRLSDGAYIFVVGGIEADRTAHLYQDDVPIPPEQEAPPSKLGSNSDPTLDAAEAWLATQPACAS